MGGTYGLAAETPISSPVVAGVAGLVLSANPSLTPAQVVSILKQNADDLGAAGWDPYFGAGRVNAARAVTAAGGTSATPAAPTVSFQSPQNGSTVSGPATVQVSAVSSSGISAVSLFVDNVLYGTTTASPYAWPLDTTKLANGAHVFQATAKDALGNSSSASSSVNISNKTLDTTAPITKIASPASAAVVSLNQTVSVSATDNAGVSSVDLLVDGVLVGTDTSSSYSFKLSTKNWIKGAHTLQSRARDAAGNVGFSTIVTVYK